MTHLKHIVTIIISLLMIVIFAQLNIKDAIGFPENEENPKLVNKQNRRPVYLPSTCAENELFYPGDQLDDWICDCRPGFIYHPASDYCWAAFQRGPCREEEYLILPAGSVIPACVPNPCKINRFVQFNGKCVELGLNGPCSKRYPYAVIWVNATTLTIDCEPLYIDVMSRMADIIPAKLTICPLGCKRHQQMKC